MSDTVLVEVSDAVATITLNRPERLNAMSPELLDALSDACRESAEDESIRAVLLTGNGRAFCAGGDVKSMAEGDGSGRGLNESVDRLRRWQNQTSGMLHTMPKPTIAAVNGFAMGAGLSLALACDLRIMASSAQLGTAFAGVALSGDFGGSWFMTRLIGSGRTRELYLLNERITAEKALELGLTNSVVPDEELLTASRELATRLASGPTKTFGLMKENLVLAEHADLQTLLDREGLHQRLSGATEDHREAAKAFVEKRPPKFVGR